MLDPQVAFHELGLCVHRDMGRALIVCDGTFCIGLPLPADENEALDSPAINPGFIQRVVQEALALVTIGVGGLVMMSLEPAAKPVGQLFSRATDRRLVTHIITSIDAENRQVLEAQVREVVLQYLQLAKALVHGPGVLPGP